MAVANYKAGDWVIYRVQKRSVSPGPRAVDVFPAPHGDAYSYLVDKFWVVEECLGADQLRLRTRRGKQHVVVSSDPCLRRARWWEKWIYAARFRAVEESIASSRVEIAAQGRADQAAPSVAAQERDAGAYSPK